MWRQGSETKINNEKYFLKSICAQLKHLSISNPQEANALFNDTLNTFYLRLYGIRDLKRKSIMKYIFFKVFVHN